MFATIAFVAAYGVPSLPGWLPAVFGGVSVAMSALMLLRLILRSDMTAANNYLKPLADILPFGFSNDFLPEGYTVAPLERPPKVSSCR
ncbi:hypothetical protein [Azospirillum argentinense]